MLTPCSMPDMSYDAVTHQPSRSVFIDGLIVLSRICFLLVLVVAPWFFGGLATNVQLVLYTGLLISLAIWIPAGIWQLCTVGLSNDRIPLSLVPLSMSLILGAYQLSPRADIQTPQSIQRAIQSAYTQTIDETERQNLVKRALIQSLQTGQSIAPAATRFEMARLVFVLVAFFLGGQLFGSLSSQLWLWWALAINGAALAFLGISQQLSWNGKLFWFFPLRVGGHPFSSFVNRNNAAGYLCICLACAVGIVVWSFSKSIPRIRAKNPAGCRR